MTWICDTSVTRHSMPAIDDTQRRAEIFATVVEAAGAATGADWAALYLPGEPHLCYVTGTAQVRAHWTAQQPYLRSLLHPDGIHEQTVLSGAQLGLATTPFLLIQPITTTPIAERPCLLLAYDTDPRGSGACALLRTLALEVATELLILENNPTFLRAVDDAVCGITIADGTSPDVPLVYANDAFCRMTGYQRSEILGRNCRFLQGADRNQEGRHHIRQAIAQGHACTVELRNYRKDGTAFTNQFKLTCVTDRNGQPAYFVGVQRDISQRRSIEDTLTLERQRHETMLALSPIYTWRMTADGSTHDVPDSWLNAAGLDRAEAVDWRWMQHMPAADAAAYNAHLREALAHGLPFELEYRCYTREGEERRYTDHLAPVRDGDGAIIEWLGVTTDVTERREAELALIQSIYEDSLTGLLSWTGFKRNLGYRYLNDAVGTVSGYLVVMDVRNLADLNEARGYHFGDTVLRAIGGRLSDVLGADDIVARLGGDTFAMFLDSAEHNLTNAEDAAIWANAQVTGPLSIDGETVHIDAWIGATVFDRTAGDVETLMRRAQLALQAVRKDRNATWQVYDKSLEDAALTRIHIAHGLRAALSEDAFELMYQPKVALATGRTVGAEALLRWHDPEGGLRAPDYFMHVAETAQLIVPIGAWVLRQACRDLAAWQAKCPDGNPTVAVNISRVQLSGSDLPAELQTILAETGADPAGLVLEITETALERERHLLYRNFLRLKELGVSLSLDDFGVGYSALSYLHTYPFDEIKIDKSFIQRVVAENYSREIVRMIVRIAAIMGARVVAEGVETAAMRDIVGPLGCEIGQGFYYARPMPAADMAPLLLSGAPLGDAATATGDSSAAQPSVSP